MNARAKLLWSVKRELWEHPSIYFAPLAIATLVIVAFGFHVTKLPERMRALEALAPAKQLASIVMPYGLSTSVILLTSFIVAVIYCTDTLIAERRDRSILFWKSMPVSDLMTVASKVAIAFIVIPAVACVIAFATQLVILVMSTVVLQFSGVDPAIQWSQLPLVRMSVVLLYGVKIHVLWYAPFYGWLMMVSAWARRMPSLWAIAPLFAASIAERIAFGTTHFFELLAYRFTGAMEEGFGVDASKTPITEYSQLEPLQFLTAPGLWSGLVVAAAFLAAAVWLRRYRDPN